MTAIDNFRGGGGGLSPSIISSKPPSPPPLITFRMHSRYNPGAAIVLEACLLCWRFAHLA